jgi:formiminotetrahydrofolate cyclodeaminase
VTNFLDEVASAQAVPAGGSVAAHTVAAAAALLVKTIHLSVRHYPEAAAAEPRVEALRRRADVLATEDVNAYRALQAAGRAAHGLEGAEREAVVGPARSRTADVPLHVVRIAAEVSELAADLAAHGNPRLFGDAVMAGLLAAAAAEGSARLVAINLASVPGDPRIAEAAELAAMVSRAQAAVYPAHQGRTL